MNVLYSQSFKKDIERIDEVISIDRCEVVIDENTKIDYNPQLVYHGDLLKICLVDVKEETCNELIFYYKKGEAFRITKGEEEEAIVLNPKRTLFEIRLTFENQRATIECPWNTEDTKILESIGPDLGSSLYKDIQVSSDSLVWKESIGKYAVDRGCQDNPSYDVELLDTKPGNLEERPILFKSYQNIKISQGNWEIDMIKKSSLKKLEIYHDIFDEAFLVWDSPMIDAKVNLEAEPECINNFGNYLDPGGVVYGNTDCFQYINYLTNKPVGFRVTGTSGSEIDILFNKEYTNGRYTSFRCVIGEEGSVVVDIPSDLPFYHLNGIVSVGPSRITKVEVINYSEEWEEEYVPNPDKTYNVNLKRNTISDIPVLGTADYIQYRKYLGEITEVGRGTDNIDSIPGLVIVKIESNDGGAFNVDSLKKSIVCGSPGIEFRGVPRALFQVSITNNIEVTGNILSSSTLYADYKIYIVRNPAIWKIDSVPDFINSEYEVGETTFTNVPIFTLSWKEGSSRIVRVITDEDDIPEPGPEDDPISMGLYLEIEDENSQGWEDSYISLGEELGGKRIAVYSGKEYREGEWWTVFNVDMIALQNNESSPLAWQPKTPDNKPRLVRFRKAWVNHLYQISQIDPVFHPIQRAKIKNNIEIWEETLTPGKFSKADEKIELLNAMTKNFIVARKLEEEDPEPTKRVNWYYYDLNGTNRFYITDTSYNIIDTGPEYPVREGVEIVDLGTIENRQTFGRVINANRSDSVGELGMLLVTEAAAIPNSWEDLINVNTDSVLVTRELNNIYIKVGPTEQEMKNEDLVLEVDRIKKLDLWVCSNHKYVMQSFSYLKIYPDNYEEYKEGEIIPSNEFLTNKNILTGYNQNKYFPLALNKLDLEPGMDKSMIEIKAGSLTRKVTLKVVGPSSTPHDYYLVEHINDAFDVSEYNASGDPPVPAKYSSLTFALDGVPQDKQKGGMAIRYIDLISGDYLQYRLMSDEWSTEVTDWKEVNSKPNIIKIFENGSLSTETEVTYTSSTTPSIDYIDINKVAEETTNPNFSKEDYVYHNSVVPFSIKNSRSTERTRYPIEPFGIIRESSLDYSNIEYQELDFPLYMKGKDHCIWCVNNLYQLYSLEDPEFIEILPGVFRAVTTTDIYLNATGESGENIYVVSRYGIGNRTFLTNTPEKNEYTIERNGTVSEIKISSQQKIALDDKSQIEYAIPISIKSNVENERGCVFLGSLDYKAITEITEGSLNDIISVSENIIEAEGINSDYIKKYIINDKIHNLNIRIFQEGSGTDILEILSHVPDIGVDAKTVYMIPEISKDITLTELLYEYEIGEGESEYIEESDTKICKFSADFNSKYFLINVDSLDRVSDKGNWHWYEATFSGSSQKVIKVGDDFDDLPEKVINDTNYSLKVKVTKLADTETGTETIEFTDKFKKYGHHYGFYINGYAGFGNYKSEILSDSLDPETDSAERAIYLPAEGGNIVFHAGIFYAIDGIWRTEALMVPKKYEFIGDNIPDNVLWEDGNLDDNGNLILTISPRIRDEYGIKKYILHITQPHEYYPLNLYVTLCQKSFYPGPDEEKEEYKLLFLENEINIYSSGKVFGDDKIHFTHNLDHDIFDKVSFGWVAQEGYEIPTYPDDLNELFEIERSYEEGYVRLRFLPNGSRTFIKAYVQAIFEDKVIGQVPANQGYYGLYMIFKNPWMKIKDGPGTELSIPNFLSRISPKPFRLYISRYEGNEPVYVYINSRGPCKTNADNSEATINYCGGRGVYQVSYIARKEFYDESERNYQSDIIDSVELINLSPSTFLESSSVSFSFKDSNNLWGYAGDPDALIVPRYNTNVPGSNYITNYSFNHSYVEFEYEVKKDYIREELTLSEVCKINLKDVDLNSLAEFFMSTITLKRASDEIDPFVFKDYVLRYGCEGGTQQTAHNPPYYNIIEIVHLGDGDWSSPTYTSGNNYIEFTSDENMTKVPKEGEEGDVEPAYFRTTMYRVDVFDPRCLSYRYLLGSYYVTLEQEPDITNIVDNKEEPEPEPPTPPQKSTIWVRYISNIHPGTESGDYSVELNGYIEFFVSDGSGGTVAMKIELPQYSASKNNWKLCYYDSTINVPFDPETDPQRLSYYSKACEVEPECLSPNLDFEDYYGQTISTKPVWADPSIPNSVNQGCRAYTYRGSDGVSSKYYLPYIIVRNDGKEDCIFEKNTLYNIIFLESEDQAPIRPFPAA